MFHELINNNPDFLSLDLEHMGFISNFSYPLLFEDKSKFEEYRAAFSENVEIRPVVGGYMVDQPFFKKYLSEKNLSYECPNAKKIHAQGFYFSLKRMIFWKP